MRLDKDIIEEAFKQGMPKNPMREGFSSDEKLEEYYGYWMTDFGRLLTLRQQIRNSQLNDNNQSN